MSKTNRIFFLAFIAVLALGAVTLMVQNRALQAQVGSAR